MFNYGNQAPSADDTDKPWIKLDENGKFERVYGYSDGYWVAPHPCPALGKERRIWTGTPEELKVYEDNSNTLEAADANLYRGPFWEVDTDIVPQASGYQYSATIFDSIPVNQILDTVANPNCDVIQPHSLGEVPDKVTVTYLCAEDDTTSGYSKDDEVSVESVFTWYAPSFGEHKDPPSVSVTFNETNVIASMFHPADAGRLSMMAKDSRSVVTLPADKFRLRIRVWKRGGDPVSTSTSSISYIKRTRRVYYTG